MMSSSPAHPSRDDHARTTVCATRMEPARPASPVLSRRQAPANAHRTLRLGLLWGIGLLSASLLTACGGSSPSGVSPDPGPVPTASPTPRPVVVAAAGDVACGFEPHPPSECQAAATSDLLLAGAYDPVLLLGDASNWTGTANEFRTFFEPTWGRVKARIRPVPGNHDYETAGARGYFDYFNGTGNADGPAGRRDRGYYSFDLGTWHVVALNSNCAHVDCRTELTWLNQDLAAHPARCILAYWHHPLFTSDPGPRTLETRPFFQALYEYGAELVLTGHIHNYQRFPPQGPAGARDDEGGIRQFVVGTGGYSLYRFTGSPAPNTEVRSDASYGVLQLLLYQDRFDWEFLPIAGQTFRDSGTGLCR